MDEINISDRVYPCAKCGVKPVRTKVIYHGDRETHNVVLCPNHCGGYGALSLSVAIYGWNKFFSKEYFD